MDDELLPALGRVRRDELAAEGDAMHAADPPLTSQERERVLAGVFAELDDRDAPHHPPAAKVLAPSRWRVAVVGAALAIAAALVLVLARPAGELAPLPGFAITRIEGGTSSVRSEPGQGPLQLRSPSDAIDIVITPEARVQGDVAVVVVARSEGTTPRIATITDRVERSANGAVRIRGPLDRFVELGRGTWHIEWWLSHEGAEPRTLDALADPKAARAWRRVTTEAIIATD
jgi:hypothetical protein